MTASYLRAFELSEAPFSKELPDAELWLPPSKQALVDEMVEALSAKIVLNLATTQWTLRSKTSSVYRAPTD